MWSNIIHKKKNVRSIAQSNENISLSLILKVAIIILILSFLPLLAGAEYSATTKKCIACHNDTVYPLDSDGDGVAAPYTRPHNDNGSICEACHGADPHKVKFIQPDGTLGGKSTAASCPACHQTGVQNFSTAFMIPVTLKHSSDPLNGSVWGSYWINSNPKEACIYCHNNTLHNILPLGRILEWTPGYIINSPIGSDFSCSNCHYSESIHYDAMAASFTAENRPIPPEITNGTSWNGISENYFNHILQDYTDLGCVPCHGNALSPGATMSEFMHNVNVADMNNCLGCHRAGSSIPDIDDADLGAHINLNLTGGSGSLTSEDCRACHYNNPHTGTNPTNTYYCIDCHNKTQQLGNSSIRSTKKFDDKLHGKVTCINCHIADGTYHQGNPRGSIANSTYVNRNVSSNPYVECGDCHLAANLDDAPFYAPGGGSHVRDCGNSGGCHSGNTIVAAVHSTTPYDNSNKKPQISDPKLNSSTVTQGTDVNISVTVNVTLISSQALVDGAQYQINNSDNTQIIQPWTPMIASDGNFNSISEGAFARINTTNLPAGTYNIFARGMGGGWAQNRLQRYYPMNGDVSSVKSVPLTVQLQGGFITGRITSGVSALEGALVTTTGASDITGPDGTYSLSVPPGTYTVTASKAPEYDVQQTSNVDVTAGGTTSNIDMTLSPLPTGTISGTVTNV